MKAPNKACSVGFKGSRKTSNIRFLRLKTGYHGQYKIADQPFPYQTLQIGMLLKTNSPIGTDISRWTWQTSCITHGLRSANVIQCPFCVGSAPPRHLPPLRALRPYAVLDGPWPSPHATPWKLPSPGPGDSKAAPVDWWDVGGLNPQKMRCRMMVSVVKHLLNSGLTELGWIGYRFCLVVFFQIEQLGFHRKGCDVTLSL